MFINWILLALGAAVTMIEAVVCLMMLPWPVLAVREGADFTQLVTVVLVGLAFTLVAAAATWLLQARRRGWAAVQGLLALAVAAVIVFYLDLR